MPSATVYLIIDLKPYPQLAGFCLSLESKGKLGVHTDPKRTSRPDRRLLDIYRINGSTVELAERYAHNWVKRHFGEAVFDDGEGFWTLEQRNKLDPNAQVAADFLQEAGPAAFVEAVVAQDVPMARLMLKALSGRLEALDARPRSELRCQYRTTDPVFHEEAGQCVLLVGHKGSHVMDTEEDAYALGSRSLSNELISGLIEGVRFSMGDRSDYPFVDIDWRVPTTINPNVLREMVRQIADVFRSEEWPGHHAARASLEQAFLRMLDDMQVRGLLALYVNPTEHQNYVVSRDQNFVEGGGFYVADPRVLRGELPPGHDILPHSRGIIRACIDCGTTVLGGSARCPSCWRSSVEVDVEVDAGLGDLALCVTCSAPLIIADAGGICPACAGPIPSEEA